jgi:hypothetical protein
VPRSDALIDIFVTHYSTADCRHLDRLTLDTCREIQHVTPEAHTLTIIGWLDDVEATVRLAASLDALGAVLMPLSREMSSQPAVRNAVLREAQARGHAFVLLHNDVQPAVGWLDRLGEDLAHAEFLWGKGNCLVSPHLVPFYGACAPLALAPEVLTLHEMRTWCKRRGIRMRRESERLECPPWVPATDDGHQLMIFMTRASYFDAVGGCDEAFEGINLDDVDWGMRALLAGKRNLRSRSALVGHVSGGTFGIPAVVDKLAYNLPVFRAKWGEDILQAALDGSIWGRIRTGRAAGLAEVKGDI